MDRPYGRLPGEASGGRCVAASAAASATLARAKSRHAGGVAASCSAAAASAVGRCRHDRRRPSRMPQETSTPPAQPWTSASPPPGTVTRCGLAIQSTAWSSAWMRAASSNAAVAEAAAQALELAPCARDRRGLAMEDRRQGRGEGVAIALADAALRGQRAFRATQPAAGEAERQDPLQTVDRAADLQPAEIGTEHAHAGGDRVVLVHHAEPGRG